MKWKQTFWDIKTDDVFEGTIENGKIIKMVKIFNGYCKKHKVKIHAVSLPYSKEDIDAKSKD